MGPMVRPKSKFIMFLLVCNPKLSYPKWCLTFVGDGIQPTHELAYARHKHRAEKYIRQLEGYSAFIPEPLPPTPPIDMNGRLVRLLSDADRALGRLDGVTTILPNPDLFVSMYVKQEAVFSSQIEGTQGAPGRCAGIRGGTGDC